MKTNAFFKNIIGGSVAALGFALAPALAFAERTAGTASLGDHLVKAVVETLIFSALGLMMMILAFKVKDWLLPGNLVQHLIQEKNVAMAIVTASFILGICIIIAAAISA